MAAPDGQFLSRNFGRWWTPLQFPSMALTIAGSSGTCCICDAIRERLFFRARAIAQVMEIMIRPHRGTTTLPAVTMEARDREVEREALRVSEPDLRHRLDLGEEPLAAPNETGGALEKEVPEDGGDARTLLVEVDATVLRFLSWRSGSQLLVPVWTRRRECQSLLALLHVLDTRLDECQFGCLSRRASRTILWHVDPHHVVRLR